MHDATPTPPRPNAWLTAALASAAILYLGYHLLIALDSDDTNHLETPLAMAVAVQLRDGPSALYGPFSGARPTVLIHAPLYYRLAGLLAWPLAAAGVDRGAASLASGRWLALLATAAGLVAVGRLARLDGAPKPVGLWAALLVAAAPVFGSFPVTVRPDTLGIALQTTGVLLVLRSLRDESSRAMPLALAYAAFALAACTKQHFIVSAGVSSLLLAIRWWRSRAGLGALATAHAVGLSVLLAYYGAEELLTGGWMSRSVFVLPGTFGRISPASWSHVSTVARNVAVMSVGLLALAASGVAADPRRALGGRRLDAALLAYLAAELAAMVALCRNSEGAWTNYAMPAVVYAAALTARALGRVVGARPTGWRLLPIGAAALALVAADARLVAISAGQRLRDRDDLAALLDDPRVGARSPDALYFVGAPQHNRRFGRAGLAHDEWLYGAYEALGAAEPRSRWLGSALAEGPVVAVVMPDETDVIRGLGAPLPSLGYRPIARFGRYRVWERADDPSRLARRGPG